VVGTSVFREDDDDEFAEFGGETQVFHRERRPGSKEGSTEVE
jgi:hypothetical protein